MVGISSRQREAKQLFIATTSHLSMPALLCLHYYKKKCHGVVGTFIAIHFITRVF